MALPRAEPQDVSSKILSRIDEATNATLDSALARSWIEELDETIQATKQRIHDRIHSDLPLFEQQLASSKSVQTRLRDLTTNVDVLNDTLSNPQNGLIPTLAASMAAHASATQESLDATVLLQILTHLAQCNTEFQRVTSLVRQGNLPEAVQVFGSMDVLIHNPPASTAIMQDLKRQFTAMKARTEEQLDQAYSESVFVSVSSVVVRPSVQGESVPFQWPIYIYSETHYDCVCNYQRYSLPFLRLLSQAISIPFVGDLVHRVIDPILSQPSSVLEAENEIRITQLAHRPLEILSGRLENLGTILTFLTEHLFSNLPQSEAGFTVSVAHSVTTSVLNNLIVPSLPNAFDDLPSFMEFLGQAVSFEEYFIIGLLGSDARDRPIAAWAEGVNGHYERKRRTDILDTARQLFVTPEDLSKTIVVQVEPPMEQAEPDVVAVNEPSPPSEPSPPAEPVIIEEDDGWGLDDDMEAEPEPQPEEPPSAAESDAWGFDEEGPSTDNSDTSWDDPWADDSSTENRESVATSSPKVATRLEKLAAKGKKETPVSSPLSPSYVAPVKSPSPSKRPPDLAPRVPPKESFVVSARMKDMLSMVEDVLDEGTEFAESPPGKSPNPGSILLQTSTSVLELYRAMYPVVFSAQINSLDGPVRFSNNCLYLSNELEWLEGKNALVEDRLAENRKVLKLLSESWMDDAIKKQRESVDKILDGAQGFTSTSEQERYDECEEAVNSVLQTIKRVGNAWKDPLSTLQCRELLDDVLALPDITAAESQRLGELCKILCSLEGLFLENEESAAYAYVRSWLKYNYLYELLEASMADITYLFEEGALVDFETDRARAACSGTVF